MYFSCDFSDCYFHLHGELLKHNISDAVSSTLLQVSLVYLEMEISSTWEIIMTPNYRCIAVIHIQLYTYTCGNKINNNDERTHFFRKNISLTLYSKWLRKGCEKVMCER